MSKIEMLRVFVNQRLTAAADEIFQLFERTIAEYKEELEFTFKETHRQQKLLDTVYIPEERLHRADVQQLVVVNEEVPPEQQEWRPCMDQEDPQPAQIKEEEEELWTCHEGEQLQWLKEADIKFPFSSVPVKSEEEEEEDDEEKAQSSQLHESQSEENREAKRTEAEEEDWGGPKPSRDSDSDSLLQPAAHDKTSQYSESETDDSRDWDETEEPQSGLYSLQYNEVPLSDLDSNTGKPSVSTSEYARSFGHKGDQQEHSGVQTGEKPYSCSHCDKRFTDHSLLRRHQTVHTGEKPYSCSFCSKRFADRSNLKRHRAVHTGEKPFSCSLCSKTFARKGHLRQHLAVHSGEKPFICSVCSKSFADRSSLRQHLFVHTGVKPFSCSLCSKTFARQGHLRSHLAVHTGERKRGQDLVQQ